MNALLILALPCDRKTAGDFGLSLSTDFAIEHTFGVHHNDN
jgi:hypothetical protein